MIKEEITTIYVTEDGHRFHKKEDAEKYEMEHSSKEDLYSKIKTLEEKIKELERELLEEKSKNNFPNPYPQTFPPRPNPDIYPWTPNSGYPITPWNQPPVMFSNNMYAGTKDGTYQLINKEQYDKLSEQDKQNFQLIQSSNVKLQEIV